MRHRRIPKSDRHKKLKLIGSVEEFNFVKDDIIKKHLYQPVPNKLKEILESKKILNKKRKKKKEKIDRKHGMICVKPSEKFELETGMTRIPKPLPRMIVNYCHESYHHFMNRLNRMVNQSIAEANLEEHFEIDLGDKINETVNNSSKKHLKLQEELLNGDLKKKIERKREKNRLNSLRRKANKLKKQHRLIKLLDKSDEDCIFAKDSINFGERVHCPPNSKLFQNKAKN